jgi:hypothetical protein
MHEVNLLDIEIDLADVLPLERVLGYLEKLADNRRIEALGGSKVRGNGEAFDIGRDGETGDALGERGGAQMQYVSESIS